MITKCLINYETITNFILQMLINTLNLKNKKSWKKYNKIKTLSNHKMITYDKYELKIPLIDFCRFSLILDVEVIAVNISKFDVILDLSWL